MWQGLKQKIIFWQNPSTSDGELLLNRRRIYIMPNRAGFVYALLLVAIFITSINYNLNLGYALNFVLISCGWLAINLTYRNLAGIGLTASPSSAVFLGELTHFTVHLNNRSRKVRYALALGFDRKAMQHIDIDAQSSQNLTLATPSLQRGWQSCPTIRIHTVFPFGLLIAWSYWRTTQQVLVFPRPEANPPPLPENSNGDAGSEITIGSDEFSGVRNYHPGDPRKNLAWRQMARIGSTGHEILLSKQFEGVRQKTCVLDFSALPTQMGTEYRLSRLCAWLLIAEQQQLHYGFRLGSLHLTESAGEDHQLRCLQALALYGHE